MDICAGNLPEEVTAQDHVTEAILDRMVQIEHQGDNAAHTIIRQLHKTFMTPFDRQDVHALAMEMDDITDMIHNIVSLTQSMTGENDHVCATRRVIGGGASASCVMIGD